MDPGVVLSPRVVRGLRLLSLNRMDYPPDVSLCEGVRQVPHQITHVKLELYLRPRRRNLVDVGRGQCHLVLYCHLRSEAHTSYTLFR